MPSSRPRCRALVAALSAGAIASGGLTYLAAEAAQPWLPGLAGRAPTILEVRSRAERVSVTSHAVILNLIAATTTTTGLTVQSQLNTNTYPTGITISDEQFAQLRIERDLFHGEWNYTILPRAY